VIAETATQAIWTHLVEANLHSWSHAGRFITHWLGVCNILAPLIRAGRIYFVDHKVGDCRGFDLRSLFMSPGCI